jgi:predicted HTH domain antitoxin
MSAVIVEIPESFARSFGLTDEEAARNARLELALQMYREGKWSTRKAGEFAGLNRWGFLEIVQARKIEAPYTEEDLEQDLRYGLDRV